MNFNTQKTRAKAQFLSNRWRNERQSASSAIRGGRAADVKRVVANKSFDNFANKAYKAKRGYALRVNPKTGEKEMFVRGTTFRRGGVEWLQNIVESPMSSMVGGLGSTISGDVSRHFRRKYSKFLTGVARKNKVDVVYGHSRGAAVIQDMNVPDATKLALDGATILNKVSTVRNYRQNQWFDRFIGYNNRYTIAERDRTPIYKKRYHRVWQP